MNVWTCECTLATHQFSSPLSGSGEIEWPHQCQHSGTVISTVASQRQGPGFNSGLGSLSVWSLHILPVSAWVSSECSGFLPHSNDVPVQLIGHAKFALSVPRYMD